MKSLKRKLSSQLTTPILASSITVGTLLIPTSAQSAWNFDPSTLTNVNGTLYFSAYDTNTSVELWKSNGTSAGTVLIKDIYPTGTIGSDPGELTNVNGTLFFTANNGTQGRELWKSNGTRSGTVLVHP